MRRPDPIDGTARAPVAFVLVVPDPPPVRTHPGAAADRNSPNAGPLALAGRALVRTDPSSFPVTYAQVEVVFGKTMPDVDPLGYQPDDPIREVLEDLGVVEEPEGWDARTSQDPDADHYVAIFRAWPAPA